MLPSAAPPPPPPAPPAAVRIIEGSVSCTGCPDGPIWVQAWPAVDRYNWPWWNVYGFLDAFHKPAELDAIRPQPIAQTRLERPGPFRLELPAGGDAHVFARLDRAGAGSGHGPAAGDWVGRFPRNPAPPDTSSAPLPIVLYPLVWSPDFETRRYRSPEAPPQSPRLRDATAASGAVFRHCQGGDIGQLPIVVGAGALLEDLDGDGDLDLVAVQGLGMCGEGLPTTRLFANDGKGHFRDVTEGSRLGLRATGMGVFGGDYDRDGDIDLYFTTYRGGHLYRNEGQLQFADVTRTAGLAGTGTWPVGASFGDVDGDGWLDLFVANYVTFSPQPPFTPDAEIPTFVTPMLSSPFAFPAQPDQLFLNLGNGSFRAAPEALGAADPAGKGMAAALADLDRDGDLDLYVTNDCTKERVFENRGGRFIDVTAAAGAGDHSSGMGIALGDIDGDGLAELFSPHWLNEPPVLYRNVSTPDGIRLDERTVASGLAPTGNGLTGWAAHFLDFDLDGDLDLFVSNGHTHPGRDPRTLEPQPLQLLVNDGTGRFTDVSSASGPALLEPRVHRGAAFGDVDGDGDVDAYVAVWNGEGKLLLNETTGQHWLKVRLRRASGERGAIGSRIELRSGGRSQVRDVVSGVSYLSHPALETVFGLGAGTKVESLVVVWPGGRRERYPAPRPDTTVTLVEGQGRALR